MTAAGAAVAVLAALVLAATSINLGAATGNANTISQRGDAKVGLSALERSGVGAGALTPIEILTTGGDPSRLEPRQNLVAPARLTPPAPA